MSNGIDVGKVSDEDFANATLDKQVPILYRGIKQTQTTQQIILDTLNGQEDRFDKRYIRKPKLFSMKTLFSIGVLLAGLIYGLVEYLK